MPRARFVPPSDSLEEPKDLRRKHARQACRHAIQALVMYRLDLNLDEQSDLADEIAEACEQLEDTFRAMAPKGKS